MVPAHAGMDRLRMAGWARCGYGPRTRGDGPDIREFELPPALHGPRTRGDGPYLASDESAQGVHGPRTRGDGPLRCVIVQFRLRMVPAGAGMSQ
jgi:hypothetical protein